MEDVLVQIPRSGQYERYRKEFGYYNDYNVEDYHKHSGKVLGSIGRNLKSINKTLIKTKLLNDEEKETFREIINHNLKNIEESQMGRLKIISWFNSWSLGSEAFSILVEIEKITSGSENCV